MERAYGEDLAFVHDDGFGAVARAAAAELVARLGDRRGLVVELGCGSGISAAVLADAGFEVLGVDLSNDLLALARKRAPAATFVRASALSYEIPPCLAVTAVGEVLGYAFDPVSGAAALEDVFARAREALEPGGVFLFDLAGPGREQPGPPRRSWIDGDGWVVCVEASVEGDRLERRITTFREHAGAWRRSDETHTLVLHDPADVVTALERAGFSAAETLACYGDQRFDPGTTVFAAVAPSR